MSKKIFFLDTGESNERNLFESREHEQNTAQCQSCYTNWSTKKQSVSRCPFCGSNDVIVTPGVF